jgi:Helix-turn-helix domain
MPEARSKLDPDAGPVQAFAQDLRMLREKAGNPDYRSMARRVGCAPSTLSTAATGRKLPTLETTLAFVRACGGDHSVQADTAARWRLISAELARAEKQQTSAGLAPVAIAGTAPSGQRQGPAQAPARVWWRAPRILALAATAGVVLAAVGIMAGTVTASPPRDRPAADGPSSAARPVTASVPERGHGLLVLAPGEVADLDTVAPKWGIVTAPGSAADDVWFSDTDHALHGNRNADIAILPPGSAGTFEECALEQDYGVTLAAREIRPGQLVCNITSDNRVALLRIIDVRRAADGTLDQVTFDVVVWVPLHKT